jgi:hypothetical protein
MDTALVPAPWVPTFLQHVAMHGMINKAAKAVGVTLKAVERMAAENIEFEDALREAEETAADRIEEEVQRRAIDGVPKGVYYQGALVDTEVQYSDSLLALLIKAKRRRVFGDKQEITGANGGPLTVLVRTFGAPPDPGDPSRVIEGDYTTVSTATPNPPAGTPAASAASQAPNYADPHALV